MPFLENQFEKNVLVTSVDYVFKLGAEVVPVAAERSDWPAARSR